MNLDNDHTLRDKRFTLFIALFAAFALMHEMLDAVHWVADGVVGIALGCGSTLAAAALLAQPSSTPRLIVLLLVWTAHKVQAMPAVPNHILFTSIVNLTLLAALLVHAIRGRGSVERSLDELAAPAIRVGVIILYGFAVLHKLNTDYFDPAVSCGPQLFREMGDHIPFLPTGAWIEWPGIAGSLVAEGTIGLLLLFRRTRALAIAIGLIFHGMLVFHFNLYVASFTALIFSLFALFLPLPYVAQITRWRPRPIVARYAPLAIAMLVIIGIAGLAWGRGSATPEELRELVASTIGPLLRIVITIYAAIIVVLGLRVIWTVRPFPAGDAVFRFGHPAFMVMPVLLLFNGLSPYLGLKTQTSFSMFSNLRTELRSTNHFFMPVGLRLADFQEQMVIVEESTSPALQGHCTTKEWIPLFELRRAAAEDNSDAFRVVYRHVGDTQRIVAARAGEADPLAAEVFDAPSLLQRKLMYFRPVPPHGEACSCRH